MSIDSVTFRTAGPEDQHVLDDMNVVASLGAIKPELEFPDTKEFLAKHPDVAAFSQGFGRAGDIGVIAEDADGKPLGAVWGREYPRTEDDGPLQAHSFEITMAVAEAARNRGVGRQLLNAVAIKAAIEGKEAISLGVHEKSDARRLYEREGFKPLRNEDGTEARINGKYVPMVRKLDTESSD